MTDEFVSVSIDRTIATITVRRPEALNALNAGVLQQLERAVLRLSAEAAVRVLLLTGDGEKAFIAGADIPEFLEAGPTDALVIAERIKRVVDVIVRCPKPVIAVVNGYCFGGGFELALACDLRIASKHAQFGLPEIKLGIMPGGGGTVRLTKLAGSSVARMMAMTGDAIAAQRAYEFGLITSVHEPAELLEAATLLARRLAVQPPIAFAQLKSVLHIAVDADTETACQAELKAFAICFSTADKTEGIKAFLEKRKPIFRGA
ncbi:enoyl-CoA hydratase/isomerase family protein [Rhizobium lusitanum]|uniref:enoyl-CoA hydratase/isomerase family protein n=1 Tax=Rhizobium lusitanum TaxID=293958 RepID=UPI001574CB70|nr:enoyl-CoA hydratase-related protein [Rhizobium lusitanum]NTJ11823.1 crotonase [Rhizobium lusitanum]